MLSRVPRALSQAEIDHYREHGWLRIERVFEGEELDALDRDLDWLIQTWAVTARGWRGPWRQDYMDAETEEATRLVAMHDVHLYSQAWARAMHSQRLGDALEDLLGPEVELHHSTLHVKPPGTGHPFPMHQDVPFYPHADDRYVDTLVHLDDTSDANGCIRFLDGSHRLGPLEHITLDGASEPHLPTDVYRLDDTVPVPARRGDVVAFHPYTIHGSRLNTTDRMRRLVRVGFRHPDNRQLGGQSVRRPGQMLRGRRPRAEGAHPFSTEVG
jgi:phytanoyl-CoA hydroxylase